MNNPDLKLDQMTYVQDSVPTSNRDKRLNDPNRLNIFKFKNGKVVVYGANDEYIDDRYHTFSESSWKSVLDNLEEYGYIDLTDENNLGRAKMVADRADIHSGDINFNRDKNKQYLDKDHYGNEDWRTKYDYRSKKFYDKSGYPLNPDKYKNMLMKFGKDDYAHKLEICYDRIKQVAGMIDEARNGLDIFSTIPDHPNSFVNDINSKNYKKSYNSNPLSGKYARFISNSSEDYQSMVRNYNEMLSIIRDIYKSGDESEFEDSWIAGELKYNMKYILDLFRRIKDNYKEVRG